MYYYSPGCPMGTFPYTIMAGDTLYSIAMKHNTTVNEIIRANPRVNPYCLRIGQRICIPMPPAPRPCPAGTIPYTVRSGDTFYSISREFNISVMALMEANPGVDPDSLRIGQRLCIPQPSRPPMPPRPPATGCPSGTFAYTIRAGDTFFSLAQRFNTTVEAIQRANPNVDPNNLQIGQRICIPEATIPPVCPSGTFAYIIRSGDTFFRLAQRFNTTVEAIQRANPGVDPNNLQIGQRICIPEEDDTPPGCPSGTFAYTIRSGDTFYSLAQRFNTTVEAIQRANPGVDPNNLQIGQRICIPEATIPPVCPSGTFAYVIRSGDTFFRLAQRFDTTVEAIQRANPNVDPNNLQIGQRICIPE